jgi:hypothetical protein
MAKNSVPKITSAWDLLRASFREYRANWKPYMKIIAIVAIPANLISLMNLSGDTTAQSYISFASVVMNVALIWALVQHERANKVPKVAAAYYEGTGGLVSFMLVSFALVVIVLPAAIGSTFYGASSQAAGYAGSFGPEQIVLGLLALILSLPTLYWLVRCGLAPFITIREGLRPMAALKLSRRYTLGRFWPVAGRFALLAVFILVLLVPIGLIYFLLSLLNLGNTPVVVFNILATLTVLPIANIYMMRLYRALEHAHTPAQ